VITRPTATVLVFGGLSSGLAEGYRDTIEYVIETATGWPGLGIVFVYSFLIAFALPGPSEIVLAAPIDLGLSAPTRLASITLVSAGGKTVGSLLAFHLGQEVKRSGPVVRRLRRSRFDVLGWSERRSIELARRYGYGGLALALCLPLVPDTISIYAFAVLEEDYLKFAIATFLGSVGRLVLVIAVFRNLLI
jgi:membrane protein YqaA with SNARE-associated domain